MGTHLDCKLHRRYLLIKVATRVARNKRRRPVEKEEERDNVAVEVSSWIGAMQAGSGAVLMGKEKQLMSCFVVIEGAS